MALRAAALLLLGIFLLDPVLVLPQTGRTDAVVPVLIDSSRSMRLADVDGRRRIDVAKNLVKSHHRREARSAIQGGSAVRR